MILCPPAKVVQLLGVTASSTPNENIVSALQLASRAVEQLVGTEFSARSQTDFFTLPRSAAHSTPSSLRLTNGYAVSPVVRYATDGLPLRSKDDGVLLDASDYMLNETDGVVALFTLLPDTYSGLSVTYASGFDTDPSKPEELAGLPDWVGDAAAAVAAYTLKIIPFGAAQRTATIKGSKPGQMEREVFQFASRLVLSHCRRRANLQFPAWHKTYL